MGMIDRYLLLSYPRYHDKNLKFIINILLENDYLPEFIFEMINSRLKILFHKQFKALNNTTNSSPKQERTSWFVLPYIKLSRITLGVSLLSIMIIIINLNMK